MLLKVMNIVLFWRRNNVPSIIFKSLFWGALAWLLVGIFTSFTTALIGGAAAAGLAAAKYAMRARKDEKALLKSVGGDKEQLKKLKGTMKAKGFAGGLMTEMIRSEVGDGDDDDYEAPELDEATLAANKATTSAKIEKMTELCVAGKYLSKEAAAEAAEELLEEYSDGNSVPGEGEYICAFLPDNMLSFDPEDYVDDDDHADLVQEFASATNGKWTIENPTSKHDAESDKWVVSFSENGKQKTWRFAQSRDALSEKFLMQVIAYAESRSGYVSIVDTEDEFAQVTLLPPEIHEELYGAGEEKLSA